MKTFKVIRSEIRDQADPVSLTRDDAHCLRNSRELWLLVSSNLEGIEIPGAYAVLIDQNKQDFNKRNFGERIGLFWVPISKVDYYDELPKPTTYTEYLAAGGHI